MSQYIPANKTIGIQEFSYMCMWKESLKTKSNNKLIKIMNFGFIVNSLNMIFKHLANMINFKACSIFIRKFEYKPIRLSYCLLIY